MCVNHSQRSGKSKVLGCRRAAEHEVAPDWRSAPSQRTFVAGESLLQATRPSEVRASV